MIRDRAGPPLNTLLVVISLVFSCSLPPKQGRDTCVVEMCKRVCVLLYSVCVCACACLYSHIVIKFIYTKKPGGDPDFAYLIIEPSIR